MTDLITRLQRLSGDNPVSRVILLPEDWPEIAELIADRCDAPDGWRPIDSAPRNEDIWLADEWNMRLGFWANGKEFENFGTEGGGWIDLALAESGGGRSSLYFLPNRWKRMPTLSITPKETP